MCVCGLFGGQELADQRLTLPTDDPWPTDEDLDDDDPSWLTRFITDDPHEDIPDRSMDEDSEYQELQVRQETWVGV